MKGKNVVQITAIALLLVTVSAAKQKFGRRLAYPRTVFL